MAVRALLVLVCLSAGPAVAAPPAAPALDPEASAAYRWRVVVKFAADPRLPANLRDQVLHDVRASLQPAIGELGRVEVAELPAEFDDKSDPLLRKFAEKGWPALEGVEFRKLTGVKTHFLTVAVSGDAYRLEARQHDGSTGLLSPAVRGRDTRDPHTLGRLAGLLLVKDFGVVGTVEKVPNDPTQVRVRFRGAALPGLDRHVRQGDVFAVSVVQEQTLRAAPPKDWRTKPVLDEPKVQMAQPREFTLLQAETPLADGGCRCRVLTKFANPLPTVRGVVGFRCLKVATVEGPVQVKVVDEKTGGPLPANTLVKVRANDASFDTLTPARDAFELRDGLFRSSRPLRNVACVVVNLGTAKEVLYPVPVLGLDAPHVLRFEADQADAARAKYEQECEDLRGRVAQARTAHGELVRGLTRLIVKGENKEALERATAGLAAMVAADQELTAELNRLQQQPGAKDPRSAELLGGAAENLAAVRAGRGGIEERVGQLKEVVAKADDPVRFEKEFRARELNARIKTCVETGEIPEALDLFDQLFEVTQQAELKDRKAKLAVEWQPKNDEQKKARDYVIETWRPLRGLTEIKDALEPLKEAAAVLVKHDDRLGLRNLLSSLEPTYAKLKEILDVLDPNSEADRPAVKSVQDVTTALRKIEEDGRAALKKIEGGGK